MIYGVIAFSSITNFLINNIDSAGQFGMDSLWSIAKTVTFGNYIKVHSTAEWNVTQLMNKRCKVGY